MTPASWWSWKPEKKAETKMCPGFFNDQNLKVFAFCFKWTFYNRRIKVFRVQFGESSNKKSQSRWLLECYIYLHNCFDLSGALIWLEVFSDHDRGLLICRCFKCTRKSKMTFCLWNMIDLQLNSCKCIYLLFLFTTFIFVYCF